MINIDVVDDAPYTGEDATIITNTYNNTSRHINHNSLGTLQGGSVNERYHLTRAQWENLGGGNVYVDLTTDQTLDGVKTFVQSPIIPDASDDQGAVSLNQLNNALSGLVPHGAANGLTDDGTNYRLGGTIEAGGVSLSCNDDGAFDIIMHRGADAAYHRMLLQANEMLITSADSVGNEFDFIFSGGTSMIIDNVTGAGLQYAGDYSGTFQTYSLIDKNFGDTHYQPILGFTPADDSAVLHLTGGQMSGGIDITDPGYYAIFAHKAIYSETDIGAARIMTQNFTVMAGGFIDFANSSDAGLDYHLSTNDAAYPGPASWSMTGGGGAIQGTGNILRDGDGKLFLKEGDAVTYTGATTDVDLGVHGLNAGTLSGSGNIYMSGTGYFAGVSVGSGNIDFTYVPDEEGAHYNQTYAIYGANTGLKGFRFNTGSYPDYWNYTFDDTTGNWYAQHGADQYKTLDTRDLATVVRTTDTNITLQSDSPYIKLTNNDVSLYASYQTFNDLGNFMQVGITGSTYGGSEGPDTAFITGYNTGNGLLINTQGGPIKFAANVYAVDSQLILQPNGVLQGKEDYSSNYDANSYIQKGYADATYTPVDTSGLVPYSGAVGDINLDTHSYYGAYTFLTGGVRAYGGSVVAAEIKSSQNISAALNMFDDYSNHGYIGFDCFLGGDDGTGHQYQVSQYFDLGRVTFYKGYRGAQVSLGDFNEALATFPGNVRIGGTPTDDNDAVRKIDLAGFIGYTGATADLNLGYNALIISDGTKTLSLVPDGLSIDDIGGGYTRYNYGSITTDLLGTNYTYTFPEADGVLALQSTTLAGYGISATDPLFDSKYGDDDWVGAAQFLGSLLKGTTIGVDPAFTGGSGNYELETGRFYGQIIKLGVDTTLSGVMYFLTNSGVYTADGENRVGLYTYDQAGTLTLVASTADNPDLYAVQSGQYVQESFTGPYEATAGYYFLVFFYSNSSESDAPCFMGIPYSINGKYTPITTNDAKMGFESVTAGNDTIASSISFTSDTKEHNRAFWAGVY